MSNKNYLNYIIENFPIRNTDSQKEEFRKYVLDSFDARVENNKGHNNIVIGDVSKAKIIYTAHYDTPRHSMYPNIMIPRNKAISIAYKIAVIIPILALSFLAAGLVFAFVDLDYTQVKNRLLPILAYLVVYYGMFLLQFRGKPNKNNVNDNTSGTATVLELAAANASNKDIAFILFDNEEKGKKGSKAFASEHKEIKENTQIINLDCVGNGDNFVFIGTPKTIESETWGKLQKNFSKDNDYFFTSSQAHANSDQTSFDKSIAVLACDKSKHGLLYTGLIHTNKDTVANPKNIETLVKGLTL